MAVLDQSLQLGQLGLLVCNHADHEADAFVDLELLVRLQVLQRCGDVSDQLTHERLFFVIMAHDEHLLLELGELQESL